MRCATGCATSRRRCERPPTDVKVGEFKVYAYVVLGIMKQVMHELCASSVPELLREPAAGTAYGYGYVPWWFFWYAPTHGAGGAVMPAAGDLLHTAVSNTEHGSGCGPGRECELSSGGGFGGVLRRRRRRLRRERRRPVARGAGPRLRSAVPWGVSGGAERKVCATPLATGALRPAPACSRRAVSPVSANRMR